MIALQDVGSAFKINDYGKEIIGASDFGDVELGAIFVTPFVEKSVAREERGKSNWPKPFNSTFIAR